jgi:hypothetical protein
MILEKYNMPCHAMHPIQDLFLESFSYVLQFDMHFICTPIWTKFYSCKKWVLQMSKHYFSWSGGPSAVSIKSVTGYVMRNRCLCI